MSLEDVAPQMALSMEEIAAKGIHGVKAPLPKTNGNDDVDEEENDVPISTDGLDVELDDDDLTTEEEVVEEAPKGTVAGSGSTEKENNVWPDDADHTSTPGYTAKPKKQEIKSMEEEVGGEDEEENVEPVTEKHAVDASAFDQHLALVLDATLPTTGTANLDDQDVAAYEYEEVSAEEYAKEFNIVLEKCDDGSGFASNDGASDEEEEAIAHIDNPCVRSEPTFVGCTDADLFSASNPFADSSTASVIKTTVQFNYDLYLRRDTVLDDAVAQLEESMLQHVAGGMNFDRCGDKGDDADGGRRRLFSDSDETKSEVDFVGLSSRPVDARDDTYLRCTSNLSIEEGKNAECVPMEGKMTLYLSSRDDRFAAKHLVKRSVKSGAEDGSFVGSTDTDEAGILGVAYVENRALESARLPGNNLQQFKASAGMR